MIRFTCLNETYLLDAAYVIDAYNNETKKSLTIQEIRAHGSLIREGLTPRLNYLDNVDELYFMEDKNGK